MIKINFFFRRTSNLYLARLDHVPCRTIWRKIKKGGGGGLFQSVERATSSEEVLGSIPDVATLLVRSVSV